MVEDAVTVGKESLVVKGASHAMLTEEREGGNNKRMILCESSFVEKAEHTNRASQGRRSKIKIQKSICISYPDFVQEPSLHFIKSLELTRRCQQDGTIRVFHVAPDMSLELIDQRCNGT